MIPEHAPERRDELAAEAAHDDMLQTTDEPITERRTEMRRTHRLDPPKPEIAERKHEQRRAREEECAVCGDTFQRHSDDAPTCSQDCWNQFCNEEDPR